MSLPRFDLYLCRLSAIRLSGQPSAPAKVEKSDFLTDVTVLITAYNEESDIRAKLENTLQIDYPKEKLEILVASDCSTDKTDEIVKEFADKGVKLFRQNRKARQNDGAKQSRSKKLRAKLFFFPTRRRCMKQMFCERCCRILPIKRVGCVAGKLIYVDDSSSNVGKGAKSYWNYETFIKKSESRACSLIGASGCLYAVRKSAYQPMYAEACSDFLICTIVYRQGLRSIFEPNAVCTEETNRQTDKEMKMRVRVIGQTFTDFGATAKC